MLNKARNEGLISGIRFSRRGPEITHLMFADDTLLCFKATQEACVNLKNILNHYCTLSGQQVNFSKSSAIFSPNTPRLFKKFFAKSLNVVVSNTLGKYLGVFVDGKDCTKKNGQDLIDKFDKRLSGWKSRLLSQAGRATLIKSVLLSYPVYKMSSFSLQSNHLRKMESTTTNFFWGSKGDKKRIHLLPKDHLRLPKSRGGLGFRSPALMNKALISKQVWRIIDSPNTLFSSWIHNKYLINNTDLQFRKTSLDFICWKGIAKNFPLITNSLNWRSLALFGNSPGMAKEISSL